ncbi:MAG: toll/interleukin-1 receptor domain-containing protein, partial [Clostridiales bacterium]|nr:toll/interleukin-1 receptor domain-containing protein [Clostridiales bacterium]
MIDFYNAFISYKHAPLDIKIAEHVQRQLEHFHVPHNLKGKIQHEKITRIFRDKDELPITSDLTETLTNALEKSEYLIVICSTNTKESMWVKREIQTFLKTHTKDKIFTVLCDGEPQDVIPEELTTGEKEIIDSNGFSHMINVPVEPLSCDYRIPRARADREELPRLAAGLLGCSYDELQRRRRQYRLRRAGMIVAAAFAGVLAFGGYMLYSRMQINKAYMESLRTRSVYLANESRQLLDNGKRADAIQLALAALPADKKDKTPVTAPAIRAISDATGAYTSNRGLEFTPAWNYKCKYAVKTSIVSEDLSYLGALDDAGNIYCWDTETRNLVFEKACFEEPVRIDLPNKETFVITYSHKVEAYNIPSGKHMWTYTPESSSAILTHYIHFTISDVFLYVGGCEVVKFSLRDGAVKESYQLKEKTLLNSVYNPAVSPDGKKIAYSDDTLTTEDSIKIHIYDVETKKDQSYDIKAKYLEKLTFVDNNNLCAISTMDFVNTSVSFSLDYRLLKPATKTFSFFGTNSNKSWSQDLVYTDVSMGSDIRALPSRNAVLCYVGNAVGIFDLETGNELNRYITSSSVVTSGDFNDDGYPEFILRHGEYIYAANSKNNDLASYNVLCNNITSGAIGNIVYAVSQYDTDIISYNRSIQDDEWKAVKVPSEYSMGSTSQTFDSNEEYLVSAALVADDDKTYVRVSIIDLNTGKLSYTEDLTDVDVSATNFNVEYLDGEFYLLLEKSVFQIDPDKDKITEINSELDFGTVRSAGKLFATEKDYSSDKLLVKISNYDGSDKDEFDVPGTWDDFVGYNNFNAVYCKSLNKAFIFVVDTLFAVDMKSMDYDEVDLPDNWDFTKIRGYYITVNDDSSRVLISDGNTVLVTDASLKEQFTISRNGTSVDCAAFKGDRIYIVGDGYISVYDNKKGELITKNEMKYFTEGFRSKAWFDDKANQLYIQSDYIIFIYDLDTMYEVACIESVYCYHKATDRFYVFSYRGSRNVLPGYIKHYSVEDLVEKAKRILGDTPLDEATKS